jgi:hypothetical protein
MLACDFFPVDCVMTLQRIYVFFVMEVSSRYDHLVGVTTNPDGTWTVHQVRNHLMDLSDRAAQVRFLARDRAGQLTCGARIYDSWLDLRVHGHPARSCCDVVLAGEPAENRSTAHLVFGQIDHLRRLGFGLSR